MHKAYIALGSNVGDRENYLQEAMKLLDADASIQVIQASSIYETEPVGFTDQGPFLNMVAEVETTLSPFSLLAATQAIERKLGRKRLIRFGPRTLDLDILLFDHENIETGELQIPHPRMWERAFVLVPLAEIAPDVYSETCKQTVAELASAMQAGVTWWRDWSGIDQYVHTDS
ncbi:2-amino-4-hydroxy-6-hydroxymethyldihydropteridine diphosphokinase [Alkalihalobacillus clausii]|uniref:2-amino-4-hydroxy-6- hydroxymethyldihydropteridine diphosphokinase n=1 Tax=Shouchella clausii TaxID=79880 RepID=UPI00203CEB52|nr:2-amino-4-hydroxy-6-hydroxymethyldihydropteridine diphosphokinase [Shouchella clausii]MCM3550307.1 2-amino-4-hydroxy-6-hydroxymethyldihydropteridine diphosphokinase [Shouchella clausii]